MEEKMMILNMLQEGKISSEEACKLLDALDKGSKGNENTNSTAQSTMSFKIDEAKMEEKLSQFQEKAGKFAEQITEKVNRFAEQITEKANKAAEQSGETISSSSEKLNANAKVFSEDFSKRMEGLGSEIADSAVKFADKLVNYFGSNFDFGADKYQYSANFQQPVTDKVNINLKAANFTVKVYPSDTQDILVNMNVHSNVAQLNVHEFIRADFDGSNYSFNTLFEGRVWGKIDLFVPSSIGNLVLATSNGKFEMGNISADYINCKSSNGKLELSNVNAQKLDAITNNGRISMFGVNSAIAVTNTSNGRIEIENSKFDILDAKTSNGSIQLSGISRLASQEGKLNLHTSNARIFTLLNKTEDCAYAVDAHTTHGRIDIDIPNIEYATDKKSSSHSTAAIKTANFDSSLNKIAIKAVTSNASIHIECTK